MKLDLNDDQLQSVVAAALMHHIDQDKRDLLIKDALQYLITPKDSAYGSREKVSPLVQAFRSAMDTVATAMIRKDLEGNEQVAQAIKGLIAEAVHKMEHDNREQTVSRLAQKIVEGIYADR
jgi:predicted YcjX-like family ATPase